MTDTPDDLPSPDEFRRKMAHVDREFADARRYLSALCAEDNQALGALMAEIHRSGRAMKVLAAMAVQALDFAHLFADRLGGDVQKWLDESVMAQDTAETERDQTELGGEGEPSGPYLTDATVRGEPPPPSQSTSARVPQAPPIRVISINDRDEEEPHD